MPDHVPDWELVASEHLQDCRILQVHRDTSRSPHTDTTHEFFRIEAVDWVNVIPLTPDNEVVMVRQFRHGSRRVTLEIPGGMVDAGEDPAATAARELLEETGYAGDAPIRLGAVNPNPALFGNQCHSYAVRGATRVAEIRNEGAEATVVELVPLAQIPNRIRAGEIDHALVVTAFHWWHLDHTRAL